MTSRPDADAFVAAAERGINERDLEATAGVYADDAVLVSVTDGAREEVRGAPAIRAAWAGYLDGMAARQFWLRKTVTAVDGDVIVNAWVGGFGARRGAEGVERWRLDASGRVAEHTMWTFFDVRPSTSAVARARIGLAAPRTALAFLRAQRRHRH